MKVFFFFFGFFGFFGGSFLMARGITLQNFRVFNSLAQKPALTVGQAATLLAFALGQNCSLKHCIDFLIQKKVILPQEKQAANQLIQRAQFSRWLHAAFQMPRGLWFRLTGFGRYAHADMQALGIMSPTKGDFNSLSGNALISIIEKAQQVEKAYLAQENPNAFRSFQKNLGAKKTNNTGGSYAIQ